MSPVTKLLVVFGAVAAVTISASFFATLPFGSKALPWTPTPARDARTDVEPTKRNGDSFLFRERR